MSVRLTNEGGATATDVTGCLISLSPFVTATDVNGTYGTIGIGGNAENTVDRFRISASTTTRASLASTPRCRSGIAR